LTRVNDNFYGTVSVTVLCIGYWLRVHIVFIFHVCVTCCRQTIQTLHQNEPSHDIQTKWWLKRQTIVYVKVVYVKVIYVNVKRTLFCV
jgi:hypothetical protein